MRSRTCSVCRHLDIEEIDRRLLADAKPVEIVAWLKDRRPGDVPNKYTIGKHKKWHLQPERVQPPPPPPEPEKPKPSSQLGHPVTDDDIEQRMKTRFYDLIDQMPPERVADWLIEREKSKNRVTAPAPKAPKGPTEDEVPADIAELRAAASRALGPSASRTAARRRTG